MTGTRGGGDAETFAAWLGRIDPHFVDGIENGADGQGVLAEAAWLIGRLAVYDQYDPGLGTTLRYLASRWLTKYGYPEDAESRP